MMKDGSKRKRTKKQIKDDEEAKLEEENANRARAAKIKEQEYQLQLAQQEANHNKGAAVLMSDLVNAGVIKQKAENSYVVHAHDGELNFNYVER